MKKHYRQSVVKRSKRGEYDLLYRVEGKEGLYLRVWKDDEWTFKKLRNLQMIYDGEGSKRVYRNWEWPAL